MRTSVPGFPPHPGWHNPWVALIFYMKAAELDAAAASWGNVLLTLSLLGTAWGWLIARRRAFPWALLLWLPVPFYAYSVAYGSVPIFLPTWWPYSWYNSRYGMELLPALALGLGFAAQFAVAAMWEFKPQRAKVAAAVLFALVALNAAAMVRERPLVYVESTKNVEARRPYDLQIPPALRALLAERPGSVILMDTSAYPEIVALTGIPLRQTINESDLEIYRDALTAPAAHAAIVLAFDGDEVDRAVHAHPAGLTTLHRFTAKGQPPATIYVSDTPTQ
jgi:signal transduction histidine kinase